MSVLPYIHTQKETYFDLALTYKSLVFKMKKPYQSLSMATIGLVHFIAICSLLFLSNSCVGIECKNQLTFKKMRSSLYIYIYMNIFLIIIIYVCVGDAEDHKYKQINVAMDVSTHQVDATPNKICYPTLCRFEPCWCYSLNPIKDCYSSFEKCKHCCHSIA